MYESIDSIQLNFDASSLIALNIALGLIMFGIALALRVDDFKAVLDRPFAPMIGLGAQFLLLPAATWGLTRLLDVPPSIALGMILVSSCPGGNISNFIAHISRANTALSISVTAISTAASVVMTPLNIAFWGSRSADTRALLEELHIDPFGMFFNVMILLGVPLVLGMLMRARFPDFADRLVKPFKVGSILLFGALVLIAFNANREFFLVVIGIIFVPVFLHNSLAWIVGYGAGWLARLPREDTQAISIEVAIQNSGLGLVLIFAFFDGLGGMAVIAAWWGIWHIIAGLSVATLWNYLHKRKSRGVSQ